MEYLLEIKPQIEATFAENGMGVGEREFIWIYGPGKPLERLRKVHGFYSLLARGRDFKHGGEFIEPFNTQAIALVHNHPSGNMIPSYSDIEGFIRCVPHNLRLKYEVIASTEGAEVRGYCVMTYDGETPEAAALRERMARMYIDKCELRQKEIGEHMERFPNLTLGKSVFTEK